VVNLLSSPHPRSTYLLDLLFHLSSPYRSITFLDLIFPYSIYKGGASPRTYTYLLAGGRNDFSRSHSPTIRNRKRHLSLMREARRTLTAPRPGRSLSPTYVDS